MKASWVVTMEVLPTLHAARPIKISTTTNIAGAWRSTILPTKAAIFIYTTSLVAS